jgi:hypothetical protein
MVQRFDVPTAIEYRAGLRRGGRLEEEKALYRFIASSIV